MNIDEGIVPEGLRVTLFWKVRLGSASVQVALRWTVSIQGAMPNLGSVFGVIIIIIIVTSRGWYA